MVIFERLAMLLLPADGSGAVVEADPRWGLDRVVDDAAEDVIVWGRPPLGSGEGLRAVRRFAGDRRRALSRLRRRAPDGLRIVDAVWWTPPEIKTSRVKQALKDALAAGAAVTLSRAGRFERVVDRAWSASPLAGRAPAPRVSSGGSVRIDVDHEGGRVIFRAGLHGTPVDPRSGGRALAHLESVGIGCAPRLVDDGVAGIAGWTIETRLEGRRPSVLTRALVDEVVDQWARLPVGSAPPRALDEDVAIVAGHLPEAAPELERLVARHRDAIGALPSVVRHGDLWLGNLLERGRRLVGVVDWDAWHPSGVPGTDLMHLLAACRGAKTLAERFLRRPWLEDTFASITAPYWNSLGVSPTHEVLDAAGVAWWVGQVAANLERLPHLATSGSWLGGNVEPVLRRSSF